MTACLIPGCLKPAGVPGTARGYCSMHYNRLRRTGDPLTTLSSLRALPSPFCSVDGCGRSRWARGWCLMHYRRWHSHGAVGQVDRMTLPRADVCRIDGCARPARSLQMCQGHHLRQLRHGSPFAGATSPGSTPTCTVAGCPRKHYARRLCHAHWSALAGDRRRDRESVAAGSCTAEQLSARIAYYGGRCYVCHGAATEIDHVKPLAAGGCRWPANLRPICKPCNSRKGASWRDVHGHHAPIVKVA